MLPRKCNHCRSSELGLFDHGQSSQFALPTRAFSTPVLTRNQALTPACSRDEAPPLAILRAAWPDDAKFSVNAKKMGLYSTNLKYREDKLCGQMPHPGERVGALNLRQPQEIQQHPFQSEGELTSSPRHRSSRFKWLYTR